MWIICWIEPLCAAGLTMCSLNSLIRLLMKHTWWNWSWTGNCLLEYDKHTMQIRLFAFIEHNRDIHVTANIWKKKHLNFQFSWHKFMIFCYHIMQSKISKHEVHCGYLKYSFSDWQHMLWRVWKCRHLSGIDMQMYQKHLCWLMHNQLPTVISTFWNRDDFHIFVY